MHHLAETASLFDRFMPHGMCYAWRADILWLNVGSDIIIALAYLLIPIFLATYMRTKKEVRYPAVIGMFCLFIFCCGITHLFAVWTVWHGQYGIQGIIKAFTAAVSIATAMVLYPLIPKMLALKSPGELEHANLQLQQQIEQRTRSERQALKLQDELARLGRVNTVGQMANGLAHELNQPLLAISASADTAVQLSRSVEGNHDLLFECLDDIQKDTYRAGEIIRTLRQFISTKSTTRSSVSVNALVTQAVELVSGDAKSANVDVVIKAQELPAVNANSVQIAQVLVNLLRNSVEAFGHSSRIMEKQLTPQVSGQVVIESRFDGNSIIVSVWDNGPGIDQKQDPFKPFESVKSDGMGVGLSISREIIEAHDGQLQYVSEGAGGTTFTFNLPAAEG